MLPQSTVPPPINIRTPVINQAGISYEQGIAGIIAVFLVWWITNTVDKKISETIQAINRQSQDIAEFHASVKMISNQFSEARREATELSNKILEKIQNRKRW